MSHAQPDWQMTLYSPASIRSKKSNRDFVQAISQRKNITIREPARFSLRKGSLFRSFPPATAKLDIWHGLSHELPLHLPRNVKKVITFHDLIYERLPHLYPPVDQFVYSRKYKASCERADRIIAISQTTRDDLIDFYRIEPEKIDVVYQPASAIFHTRTPAEELKLFSHQFDLPERFFLFVGAGHPRKNLDLIVNALELFDEEDRIPLLVIGSIHPVFHEKLKSTAYPLRLLGSLRDDELHKLYQCCHALLYPSAFEGFGLPIVEAQLAGKPVICPAEKCFQEIAAAGAIYFAEGDNNSMHHALRQSLQTEIWQSCADNALRHRIRFSRERYVERLREIYLDVLEGN